MAMLNVQNLCKSFGGLPVLDGCSISVDKGEIVSLLGASGSGKTTLLNAIAGFVEADRGSILIEGKDITHLPPNRRQMGMVFQNYALFPHLRVDANIGYGLSIRRTPRSQIAQEVRRMLDLVGLAGLERRFPAELSGGQQQRVALARILVLAPRILLLDEPFSALDAKLRENMQVELVQLIRRLGLTAIFVTHDQDEALSISDRVAVMRNGRIEQVDTPSRLYDRPVSAYVADFVGTSNLLSAVASQGRVQLIDGQQTPCLLDGSVCVLVRPENLSLHALADDIAAPGLTGTVCFARHLGPTSEYALTLDAQTEPLRATMMRSGGSEPIPLGTRLQIQIIDPEACKVYPL